MSRFLLGVAVGVFGLLAVTLAVPGGPCSCPPSATRSQLAERCDSLAAENAELRERLAAVRGPFQHAGLPVGEDAARREQMRRRPVDVPEAERIPPAGVWVPGN